VQKKQRRPPEKEHNSQKRERLNPRRGPTQNNPSNGGGGKKKSAFWRREERKDKKFRGREGDSQYIGGGFGFSPAGKRRCLEGVHPHNHVYKRDPSFLGGLPVFLEGEVV